jgi:PST family polysaccharide transporter
MEIDQTSPFRSRILNALLWSAASTWATKALDFVIILLLARLLTPADFGLISLVTIYIALANVFVEGGFAQAIIQRENIEELHYDTAFWTSLAVGSSLTVLTYFFGPSAFAYLFSEPAIKPVVQVTSVLFTITALRSVQQSILTRRLQFKQLALRRALGTLVGGVTAVSLAVYGFGYWSLVALHLVSSIVGLIVLWTASDWRPHFNFSLRCFRELFAFGMHIVGRQLLTFLNSRGLNFLIGLFLGVSALGYYVLANKIVLAALDLVTTSIQSVAFPAFSRLQKSPQKLASALHQAVHFTSLLTFPMFLWLTATATLLIALLLGPKWAASAPVLQVLCLVGLLNSVGRYSHSVMLACGKANWSLYIGIVHTIGFVIGFFIAVEDGIVAVALVYVLVGYLLTPLALGAVKRLTESPTRILLKQLLPAAVASTIMLIGVLLAQEVMPEDLAPFLQVGALAVLGAVVYLSALHLVDRSILRSAGGIIGELWTVMGGRKAKNGVEYKDNIDDS